MNDNTIAIATANAKEAAELDYANLIKHTPFYEEDATGFKTYLREGTQAEVGALNADDLEDYNLELDVINRNKRIAEFERKLEKLIDEYQDDFAEKVEDEQVEVVATAIGRDFQFELRAFNA
jgi:hypothetical protein